MSACAPFAPAFADIDRRREPQCRFQSLDGLGIEAFPVEKRGVRLRVPRRGGLAPRYADLFDPQRPEDGGRVGILRGGGSHTELQDRHPDSEDPDGHAAVHARKGRPALAVPATPATTRKMLFCLDVFHLSVEISLGNTLKIRRPGPGPAACPRFKPSQRYAFFRKSRLSHHSITRRVSRPAPQPRRRRDRAGRRGSV